VASHARSSSAHDHRARRPCHSFPTRRSSDLGNTLSYMLAASFGYYLLRRRVGRLGLSQTFGALGKLVAAAATSLPNAPKVWLNRSEEDTSELQSLNKLA